MILLVSGLTKNRRAMDFIRVHGCPEYLKFSEVLVPEDADALQKACLDSLWFVKSLPHGREYDKLIQKSKSSRKHKKKEEEIQ